MAGDEYIEENVCRHLVCGGEERELVKLVLRPEWVRKQMDVCGGRKVDDNFERGCVVERKWEEKGSVEEEQRILCDTGRLGEVLGEVEVCWKGWG